MFNMTATTIIITNIAIYIPLPFYSYHEKRWKTARGFPKEKTSASMSLFLASLPSWDGEKSEPRTHKGKRWLKIHREGSDHNLL